ncbi:Putative NAD(P)H nitroreductase YdjA [Jeotgalicoccus saudimassiliensis]|uniref:Putative NAD(P)H nitroreductase n=1 Tax=Jeotgalicoccus saudimassiliensis TaxID=1461582 RepID=A0A078MBA8_9STAP|nr:nitroreductase [Jeotgalicoccus saudimassiliensis]CEA03585.1 Putative NAD(P)H nitroreductase YdjA [Jeotgalicoccus saudimassiliensis]
MNISEAIQTRRSVKIFKDIEPVSKETVEQLLQAAIMAPNHHHTEPWKFFVLQGDGRLPLSRVLAGWAKTRVDDPDSEAGQKRIKKLSSKPLIAPTAIVVALSPQEGNEKAIYIEDVSAVSAAVQNILLEAHGMGLGAIWKSGPAYYAEPVKQYFNLTEEEEILGVIFVGESDMKKNPEPKRIPFEDKTVWITEDNE